MGSISCFLLLLYHSKRRPHYNNISLSMQGSNPLAGNHCMSNPMVRPSLLPSFIGFAEMVFAYSLNRKRRSHHFGQMSMLTRIHDLVNDNSQLIIATRSPIIMPYPKATIYEFSEDGIHERKLEETNPYRIMKQFFEYRTIGLFIICWMNQIKPRFHYKWGLALARPHLFIQLISGGATSKK